MKVISRSLKSYKALLSGIFIVSIIAFLIANSVWLADIYVAERPSAPDLGPDRYFWSSGPTARLVSAVSVLTSVTSLIGFLVAAGISWRKERREGEHSDLDIEKKKLELEKLRLEIERMSQGKS